MNFDLLSDELLGRIQATQAAEAALISSSQLPPPTSGTTFVISSGGSYVAATATGTANEVSITTVGSTITFALDAGNFLKGYNDAAAIRGRISAPAKAAITGTTIPLAKITGGGTDGSITVSAEGVVTAYVAPT